MQTYAAAGKGIVIVRGEPTKYLVGMEPGDTGINMDEKAFQVKLTELMGEISTLPKTEREKLTAMAAEAQNRHAKLRKTVSDLQESLDYLRLSIKYLVFDLEATRRENTYLRKMLEEKHSGADGSDERGPEGEEPEAL